MSFDTASARSCHSSTAGKFRESGRLNDRKRAVFGQRVWRYSIPRKIQRRLDRLEADSLPGHIPNACRKNASLLRSMSARTVESSNW